MREWTAAHKEERQKYKQQWEADHKEEKKKQDAERYQRWKESEEGKAVLAARYQARREKRAEWLLTEEGQAYLAKKNKPKPVKEKKPREKKPRVVREKKPREKIEPVREPKPQQTEITYVQKSALAIEIERYQQLGEWSEQLHVLIDNLIRKAAISFNRSFGSAFGGGIAAEDWYQSGYCRLIELCKGVDTSSNPFSYLYGSLKFFSLNLDKSNRIERRVLGRLWQDNEWGLPAESRDP
jgi:hypothetical protein